MPKRDIRCSWVVNRFILSSLIVTMVLLSSAGQAFADSASISVTTTSGQSDPVAGVPRVFTLSGTAAVDEYVFVKFRAPGGAACAPSAASDSGSYYFDTRFGGRSVNGAFKFQEADTWETPGTVVFCIWLAESSSTVTPPFTQTITFRRATGTITATVSPTTPQPGQQATITVTGASESPSSVYAKIRASGGAPCAPTYSADSGEELIDGTNVNGAFTLQATTTQSTAGTYLICLWLASSSTDTAPIAGPQPQMFNVGAPSPPPPSAECLAARSDVASLGAKVKKSAKALKRARTKRGKRKLRAKVKRQKAAYKRARDRRTLNC